MPAMEQLLKGTFKDHQVDGFADAMLGSGINHC
jgi:hypothetical protein